MVTPNFEATPHWQPKEKSSTTSQLRPVVLFRPPDMDTQEEQASAVHFPTFRERTRISKDDLVVGRYSVLPFYNDLQADVDFVGAQLINNIKQHRYVADMRNWCEDLYGLTPETWYRLEDIPHSENGPFVLKGMTNSRKFDWKTHMFAPDRKSAHDVFWRLASDGLIGHDSQNIYVRKFEKLKTFMTGMNGLPVTNEFRVFVAYGEILTGAYYWSNYVEDLPGGCVPQFLSGSDSPPQEFLRRVIDRVSKKVPFFALDVGQKENGSWTVIELNDGQMSGLSENKPEDLYKNLALTISRHQGT